MYIIFYIFSWIVLTNSKMAIVIESSLHDAYTLVSNGHVVVWLSPSQSLCSGDDSCLGGFVIISNLSMLAPFAFIFTLHAVVWVVLGLVLHFKYFVKSLGSRFHLFLLKSWLLDDILFLEIVHVRVLAIELILQCFNLLCHWILGLLVLFLHICQRSKVKTDTFKYRDWPLISLY